jgi:hypothetical protein
MKLRTLLTLLAVAIFAALRLPAKDKKPSVPEVFGRAHTAYVEAVDGQQFDRDLDPDEREAIANVQDALEAWKRYVLVTEREQADIVFVVRKGRAEAGSPGTQNPPGGWGPEGPGSPGRQREPMAGAAGPVGAGGGSSEDLLEVCLVNANGKLTSPLWEHTLPDGLNEPQVLLLRQFRDAVDKAYPVPAASPATGDGAKE